MCLRADTRSQEASTLPPPPLEKNLVRLEKAASTEVRLTQEEGDCGLILNYGYKSEDDELNSEMSLFCFYQ